MTRDKQMAEAVKQMINVFTAFVTFGKTEGDWLQINMNFGSPDGMISYRVILDHVEGQIHVRYAEFEYPVYKTPAFQAFCRSLGIEPERQKIKIWGCYTEQVYVDFVQNQTSDKPRERTYFAGNEWGTKFVLQKEFVTHHETCHVCQQAVLEVEREHYREVMPVVVAGWTWMTE